MLDYSILNIIHFTRYSMKINNKLFTFIFTAHYSLYSYQGRNTRTIANLILGHITHSIIAIVHVYTAFHADNNYVVKHTQHKLR